MSKCPRIPLGLTPNKLLHQSDSQAYTALSLHALLPVICLFLNGSFYQLLHITFQGLHFTLTKKASIGLRAGCPNWSF